jgi:hypothetical protein
LTVLVLVQRGILTTIVVRTREAHGCLCGFSAFFLRGLGFDRQGVQCTGSQLVAEQTEDTLLALEQTLAREVLADDLDLKIAVRASDIDGGLRVLGQNALDYFVLMHQLFSDLSVDYRAVRHRP